MTLTVWERDDLGTEKNERQRGNVPNVATHDYQKKKVIGAPTMMADEREKRQEEEGGERREDGGTDIHEVDSRKEKRTI